MDPITIRLEDEEIAELDAEAKDRGFANRTEYIRWILRNRNGIDQNTAKVLKEHEERIKKLEEEVAD